MPISDSEIETISANRERWIRSFMRKYTNGNHEAAEDIYQDAFERILDKREKFVSGSNLNGWFSTVARNRFLSHVRKDNKVSIEDPETITAKIDSHNTKPPMDAHLDLNDTILRIAALPDYMQETLDMIVFDNYSYEQAAEELGVALGTVKSRLGRARQALSVAIESPEPQRENNAALVTYFTLRAKGHSRRDARVYQMIGINPEDIENLSPALRR